MESSTHARGQKRRGDDVVVFPFAQFKVARYLSYGDTTVLKEKIPANYISIKGGNALVEAVGFTMNDPLCAVDNSALTCTLTPEGVAALKSGKFITRGVYTLPRDLAEPCCFVSAGVELALRPPPLSLHSSAVDPSVRTTVVVEVEDEVDAKWQHRKLLRRIPPFLALLVVSTLAISPDCAPYDFDRMVLDSTVDRVSDIPADFWPALFTVGVINILVDTTLPSHTMSAFIERYLCDMAAVAPSYHPLSLLDAVFAAYEPSGLPSVPLRLRMRENPFHLSISLFYSIAVLVLNLPPRLIRCILCHVRAPELPPPAPIERNRCRQFRVVSPAELGGVVSRLSVVARAYILHAKPVGRCEYLIVCPMSSHLPLDLLLSTQHCDFMLFDGAIYFWLKHAVPHLLKFLRDRRFIDHLNKKYTSVLSTYKFSPQYLCDGLRGWVCPTDFFDRFRDRRLMRTVRSYYYLGHIADTRTVAGVLFVCRSIVAMTCGINCKDSEVTTPFANVSVINFPRNKVCLAHDCFFKLSSAPIHDSVFSRNYFTVTHAACSDPTVMVEIRSHSTKHRKTVLGVIRLFRNVATRSWDYRLSLVKADGTLHLLKAASIAMS